MKTKIVISKLFKFKKKWKVKKARRAVELMNKAINSKEFKDEVLAFEFTDRRYRYSPNDNWQEIADNEKIYDIILKGNEQYNNREDDYRWTLKIKLGRFLRQVGRREQDLIITQNWFIKSSSTTDIDLAAHWVHEYAHVLGFHHDYDRTDRRPKSIPYALGTIVKKVLS